MPRYNQGEILLFLIRGRDNGDWEPDTGFEGWDEEETEDVCYWEGINCDSATETIVEGIHLSGRKMTGTIPSELGLLKSLHKISLPGNIIEGSIPSEVAALPNLEVVNLSGNSIRGPLPVFKSKLMKKLEVQMNAITGTIDEDFGNRHNLMEELNLANNQLKGALPSSLSQMKKLNSLSFGENQFSGNIPNSLGKLVDIRFMYLNGNKLIGTIPSSLAELNHLEYLWLQDNMLSGTLPARFSDAYRITDFYVDGNKLTGTVPSAICNKNFNQDFFDQAGQGRHNDCDDIMCPTDTNSKDGIGPCTPCKDGFSNPYLGSDKECTTTDTVELLDTFYKKTSKSGWTKPWDLDDVHCHEPGIECDDEGHVVVINVKGFGLTGTIPEEIGYFKYLKELDLSDNNLTGFIPSELKFPPLEKLDISGNKLIGVVPLMFCMEPGINGNFGAGCDHIACPVGTSNSQGYATSSKKCVPCRGGGGWFLGSKSCAVMDTAHGSEYSAGNGFGIFWLVVFCVGLVAFFTYKVLGKAGFKKEEKERLEFERVSTDAEFS